MTLDYGRCEEEGPAVIATQAAVERYSAGRKSHEVPHWVLNGVVVKPCNRCGRVKEIEQFGKHNMTWDGRQNACLACTGPGGLEPAAATGRQQITCPPPPPPRPHRSPEANRESARRGAALSHAARAKKAKSVSPIPDAPPPGPGRVLADPWAKEGAS